MPRLVSAVRRAARGVDLEAEPVQALREDRGRRLVAVADREEDAALERQRRAGGGLGLGERRREVLGDAHDLAGRPHLGPEQRVGAREAVERQHRLLHADVLGHAPLGGAELARACSPSMTRVASLASGTPVALLTNGTVREPRGLTSST